MFEDEKDRLHLFSVEDKKQKGKPSWFFLKQVVCVERAYIKTSLGYNVDLRRT